MRNHGVCFRLLLSLACLFLLLVTSMSAAFAQSDAIPITVGENAVGTLTAESPSASYAVTSSLGESVTFQVLSISGGLLPRFQVDNPNGVAITEQANLSGATALSNRIDFAMPGVYIITIKGENNTTGQFVLSLQQGAPPRTINLMRDQPIADVVGGTEPLNAYLFSTTTADINLILSVLSQTSGAGVLVSLFDADTDTTLATSDSSFDGVAYRLPAVDRRYRVEVRTSDVSGSIGYLICFGTCTSGLIFPDNAPSSAPLSIASATPTLLTPLTIPGDTPTPITPVATCTVTSTAGGAVNVRSGPGTGFLIVGSLPLGTAAPVIGQNGDGGFAWFEINLNGLVGWVSASVARTEGDCSAVPFVSAPANAPLAPTAVPTQPPQNNPQPPQQPPNNDDNPPPSDALPDLEVTITQLNRPNGDDTVAIGFSVLNRGDASAPSAFVQICIDGTCNSAGFTRALAPGESDITSLTFNLPMKPLVNGVAQFYNITIQVDPDNQIQEIAKSNNTYPTQIR